MHVMNKELANKKELFEKAIDLLSGSEINREAFHETMNDLLLRIGGQDDTMHYQNIILSLLLSRWMREEVHNYKLDYCYSKLLKGKYTTSLKKRLNSIADDLCSDQTDYHVPELISIGDDIMVIVKERGWDTIDD